MRIRRSQLVLAVVASSGLCGSLAFADLIKLAHGTQLQGEIVSGTDQVVEFHVYGEDEPRALSRDQLTTDSWYSVRATTAGDDGQAHLDLARFCVENKLYVPARAQFQKAADLDESLADTCDKELSQLHDSRAAALMQVAQHASDIGHVALANRTCTEILTKYGDTDAAAAAKALSAQCQTHLQKKFEERKKMTTPPPGRWDPEFAEIEKLMASGAKRLNDGNQSGSQSKMKSNFEIGIKDDRHAIARLDNVLKAATDDAAVTKHADALRKQAVDGCIDLYMALAHLYASRSSYPDAQRTIREAQALDPGNDELKGYSGDVDMMSAASAGWGRRVRRGRR